MKKYLNSSKIKNEIETKLSKKIITKALRISLVVGIILNIINQGELIITLDFANISFLKIFLTFMVPFCVSMYTAITIKVN